MEPADRVRYIASRLRAQMQEHMRRVADNDDFADEDGTPGIAIAVLTHPCAQMFPDHDQRANEMALAAFNTAMIKQEGYVVYDPADDAPLIGNDETFAYIGVKRLGSGGLRSFRMAGGNVQINIRPDHNGALVELTTSNMLKLIAEFDTIATAAAAIAQSASRGAEGGSARAL